MTAAPDPAAVSQRQHHRRHHARSRGRATTCWSRAASSRRSPTSRSSRPPRVHRSRGQVAYARPDRLPCARGGRHRQSRRQRRLARTRSSPPAPPRSCAACSCAASPPCATSAAPTMGWSSPSRKGSILGPRLVISGKALSQTGGHADFRGRFDDRSPAYYDLRLGALGRVVDGVPEITARRARGDQGRRASHQDHGQRRRRLADRPHRLLGFSREELRGRRRRSRDGPDLRRRPPLHRRGDPPLYRCGGHSVEHGSLIASDHGASDG